MISDGNINSKSKLYIFLDYLQRYIFWLGLTVLAHILNNKSGVNFASYAHTGLPVEVFAMGVGQDQFKGYYDNTDIFNKMAEITGVQ